MSTCIPSSLDLFQRPQIQTSILSTEEISYKPLTSLDTLSSIEFALTGLNDTYIDLSSASVRLKLQILDKDGGLHVNKCNIKKLINNVNFFFLEKRYRS